MNNQRRQCHPTPVLLPGKYHGWRSLVGCSPWGRSDSDTTEQLHFYFSLSCIGEGNGTPLQCSCLENPRDGGAWWAVVYGVAQSWTRLKWLSSSSMIFHCVYIALIVYPFNNWWTFGLFPHCLLWIVLLWTFIYKFLCGNIFFIYLGYISWSIFLVHIVIYA